MGIKKYNITKVALEDYLSKGKNYREIAAIYGCTKSIICEYSKLFQLVKKFKIRRGAKKGVMPKNIFSLHRKGEKNHNWKGDKVGYQSLHAWVRSRKGKAYKCTSCGSIKNIDWANKSRTYKRDLKDWISLCRKCHIKYDNFNKNIEEKKDEMQ